MRNYLFRVKRYSIALLLLFCIINPPFSSAENKRGLLSMSARKSARNVMKRNITVSQNTQRRADHMRASNG